MVGRQERFLPHKLIMSYEIQRQLPERYEEFKDVIFKDEMTAYAKGLEVFGSGTHRSHWTTQKIEVKR